MASSGRDMLDGAMAVGGSRVEIERRVMKDGAVRWRVRWRQGGRYRSQTSDRKGDAVTFAAEIRRRQQLGTLVARALQVFRRRRGFRSSGSSHLLASSSSHTEQARPRLSSRRPEPP